MLTATDSIGIDSNTPEVAIDVSLDSFSRPEFTHASNLDDGIYQISLDTASSKIETEIAPAELVTTPVPIMGSLNQRTDLNADLELSLSSTITTDSEELVSGNYRSDFTVTVTAPLRVIDIQISFATN